MKVSSRIITIEIDINEWNLVKKDYEALELGRESPSSHNLWMFINNIQKIANNTFQTIETKIK